MITYGIAGTPNAKGLPAGMTSPVFPHSEGKKKFTTMAIEIHTVKNGQIAEVFYMDVHSDTI
jgi:hypothetical protein